MSHPSSSTSSNIPTSLHIPPCWTGPPIPSSIHPPSRPINHNVHPQHPSPQPTHPSEPNRNHLRRRSRSFRRLHGDRLRQRTRPPAADRIPYALTLARSQHPPTYRVASSLTNQVEGYNHNHAHRPQHQQPQPRQAPLYTSTLEQEKKVRSRLREERHAALCVLMDRELLTIQALAAQEVTPLRPSTPFYLQRGVWLERY